MTASEEGMPPVRSVTTAVFVFHDVRNRADGRRFLGRYRHMKWDYTQPVDIRFGAGRVAEISGVARERGLYRGLLVAGGHSVRSGLAQRVLDHGRGTIEAVFSEFSPNPDVTEVDACAELIRTQDIGFIVALGGGSALDLAKAASVIGAGSRESVGSITDYHGTGKPLPLTHLPLIAVPTTAGTGSEVTCVSVLTNRAAGVKAPIVSNGFYPELAIIDPELTYTVPPYVTACTGMDVLSQAIEGYWSVGHQPICDALAVHAARLVFEFLPKAFTTPDDREARERMCEASVTAGLAFTLPKTTSSHACSFPLTNRYGIAHGEACALTLDYFTRINAADPEGRVNALARSLGYRDADGLADAIADLRRTLGLRENIADLGLDESDIAALVRDSHHPNLDNNPVVITDDNLLDLYRGLASGGAAHADKHNEREERQ